MRWEEMMMQNTEKAAENHIDIKETFLGRVVSVNPLQVNIKGLPLESNNLVINENLLDHKIEFKKLHGIIGDTAKTYTDGYVEIKSPLKVGDFVACREMHNGLFYISCKVKVGGNNA